MMCMPRNKPARNIITKLKSPQIAEPLQFNTNFNTLDKVRGDKESLSFICRLLCINTS